MTEENKIVHVIGPLGLPVCPNCRSEEVGQCGSWDIGPFWWHCEACDHEWGHA